MKWYTIVLKDEHEVEFIGPEKLKEYVVEALTTQGGFEITEIMESNEEFDEYSVELNSWNNGDETS